MNSFFYPKLAATNIKKNSKIYIPYILTGIGTVMMYYIIYALSVNTGLKTMVGGGQLQLVLSLGSNVIAFFSVIFLFYTNSFLIKGRKKEFGLFNILGMEKKHIGIIMFFETLYVALISLFLGVLLGILFSKFTFLLLLKILTFPVQMGFQVSLPAIISTLLLFTVIFTLTLLNSLRLVHLSKPIELLKGGNVGEREPKTKVLLAIIGLITLGVGYYIALTTEEPLSALVLFFLAVILVIIGTYCLFTAGSIAFLKLLRRNKSYYYKTKHFISISGMMYRMKQNAVGLANICILSTAVLVMLSTTVSLYAGSEEVMRTRYPRNIMVTSNDLSENYISGVVSAYESVLEKHQLKASNLLDYRYISFTAKEEGNNFTTDRAIGDIGNASTSIRSLYFVPLEDYNRLMNTTLSLEDDEVFIYANRSDYKESTLNVFDKTFKVKGSLNSFIGDGSDSMLMISSYYIVVKDISIVEDISTKQAEVYGDNKSLPTFYLGFDLDVSREEHLAVYEDLKAALRIDYPYSYVESVEESRNSFYSFYGGLFFLGIFLGLLFMMATVLIIYYKQISEGYDDKDRFEIMQKVGMSHEEIKTTIRSQVLTVFFLPLVTAGIHIAFAFKFITKILAVLNLHNITLFAWCTAAVILVFALFYGVIYTLTARSYYRIVS